MGPGDPLIMTVIDLDEALGGKANLLLADGLGLYLKQQFLQDAGVRTLLPRSKWPVARTTQDIDLILRAEVVAGTEQMRRCREALDQMGFVVVEGAKWMKFTRNVDGRDVIIDLMVEGGLSWMRYSVSETAEYGDYTRGPRIIGKESRKEMKKILKEIQDGTFAKEWIKECKTGAKKFKKMQKAALATADASSATGTAETTEAQ